MSINKAIQILAMANTGYSVLVNAKIVMRGDSETRVLYGDLAKSMAETLLVKSQEILGIFKANVLESTKERSVIEAGKENITIVSREEGLDGLGYFDVRMTFEINLDKAKDEAALSSIASLINVIGGNR